MNKNIFRVIFSLLFTFSEPSLAMELGLSIGSKNIVMGESGSRFYEEDYSFTVTTDILSDENLKLNIGGGIEMVNMDGFHIYSSIFTGDLAYRINHFEPFIKLKAIALSISEPPSYDYDGSGFETTLGSRVWIDKKSSVSIETTIDSDKSFKLKSDEHYANMVYEYSPFRSFQFGFQYHI